MKVTILTHYKDVVKEILMRDGIAHESQMCPMENSLPLEIRYADEMLYSDIVGWTGHALACSLVYGVRIDRGK